MKEFLLTSEEITVIDRVADKFHEQSVAFGWHKKKDRPADIGMKIALCHSELSEALECYRKGLKDSHLSQYDGITVELADAVIRIFDLAKRLKLPLGQALGDKHRYNSVRADHKPENRRKKGGKKF